MPLDKITDEDAWEFPKPSTIMVILTAIVLPIICVIGICGNAISIVVLRRPELKGSIFVYLTVLAFNNFGSCIVILISSLDEGLFYNTDLHIYLIIYGRPLSLFFNTMAALVTCLVTIDRCLFLANIGDYTVPTFCRSERARKISVGCFVISILFSVPDCFIFAWIDDDTNIDTDPFFFSWYYKLFVWFRCIFFGFFPAAFLLIGHGYLIRKISQLKKKPLFMNSRHGRNLQSNNITLILILMIFFFLITQIPNLILNRVSACLIIFNVQDDADIDDEKSSLDTFSVILTFVTAITLTLDFVLYYIFCPPFTRLLRSILRRHKEKRRNRRRLMRKHIKMSIYVIGTNDPIGTPGQLMQIIRNNEEASMDDGPSSLFQTSRLNQAGQACNKTTKALETIDTRRCYTDDSE